MTISELFRRGAFICRSAIIDFPLSDLEESVVDLNQRELCQKTRLRATLQKRFFRGFTEIDGERRPAF